MKLIEPIQYYKEIILNENNIKNDLHKGILLIENNDVNQYLDIHKIAYEFTAGSTPINEELGGITLDENVTALPFTIGDKILLKSPFTIEWTEQLLLTIKKYLIGVADGSYVIPLMGGSGENAEVNIDVQSENLSNFSISYAEDYEIGDVLEIPPNIISNTQPLDLPPIEYFGIAEIMGRNQLFGNMNTYFTLKSETDIAFTSVPLGMGFNFSTGSDFALGNILNSDNRGKNLWFYRATNSSASNIGMSGTLIGGEGCNIRLKIWYNLITFG